MHTCARAEEEEEAKIKVGNETAVPYKRRTRDKTNFYLAWQIRQEFGSRPHAAFPWLLFVYVCAEPLVKYALVATKEKKKRRNTRRRAEQDKVDCSGQLMMWRLPILHRYMGCTATIWNRNKNQSVQTCFVLHSSHLTKLFIHTQIFNSLP